MYRSKAEWQQADLANSHNAKRYIKSKVYFNNEQGKNQDEIKLISQSNSEYVMPLCVIPLCVMHLFAWFHFVLCLFAWSLFALCLFAWCLFTLWLFAFCLFTLRLFALWLFAWCSICVILFALWLFAESACYHSALDWYIRDFDDYIPITKYWILSCIYLHKFLSKSIWAWSHSKYY